MLTLADVIEALTNIRPAQASTVITEAAVDSRLAIPGGLFVALPGERMDGHDFVADAFQRGASFALIQHKINAAYQTVSLQAGLEATFPPDMDAPICLLVENTLLALQQIARFWRHKLDLDVVGITGSVGKSTTKEVVFEVLSQHYRTLKSPGNMNNDWHSTRRTGRVPRSHLPRQIRIGPGPARRRCCHPQPG